MKNKIKYAFGALLSMMLLLSACSQADEPQQVSATEPKKEVKMREVEIEFTLDVEQADELRRAQVYHKVDANGNPKVFMTEGDGMLDFVMGVGSYSYATGEYADVASPYEGMLWVNFQAKKIVGANKGLYRGEATTIDEKYTGTIRIPESYVLSHASIVILFHPGRQTKDELKPLNPGGVGVLMEADENGLVNIDPRIFSTDVIPVTIGEKLVLSHLTLKPRGTLLRIDLKNETNQPAQVAGINVLSNAIQYSNANGAKFQPGPFQAYLSLYNRPYGDLPSRPVQNLHTLPDGGVTIAPNSVKTYYLWGISKSSFRPGDATPFPVTYITPYDSNGEPYKPFHSDKTVAEGLYRVNISLSKLKALTPAEAFPGGLMPLAYMAEADMADANTISSGGASALLSYIDLGPNPNAGVTINQPGAADIGYYLPSSAQMTAAFMPIRYKYEGIYGDSFSGFHFGKEKAPLAPYGLNGDYYYQSDSDVTDHHTGVCVLRFIGNGNKQLTAYRYTLSGRTLTIQARYLGPTFRGEFLDIANDEFWSKPHPYEVVRSLNLDPHDTIGEYAYFLLADRKSLRAERPHYTVEDDWTLAHIDSHSDPGRVRLFMRNPPQK